MELNTPKFWIPPPSPFQKEKPIFLPCTALYFWGDPVLQEQQRGVCGVGRGAVPGGPPQPGAPGPPPDSGGSGRGPGGSRVTAESRPARERPKGRAGRGTISARGSAGAAGLGSPGSRCWGTAGLQQRHRRPARDRRCPAARRHPPPPAGPARFWPPARAHLLGFHGPVPPPAERVPRGRRAGGRRAQAGGRGGPGLAGGPQGRARRAAAGRGARGGGRAATGGEGMGRAGRRGVAARVTLAEPAADAAGRAAQTMGFAPAAASLRAARAPPPLAGPRRLPGRAG